MTLQPTARPQAEHRAHRRHQRGAQGAVAHRARGVRGQAPDGAPPRECQFHHSMMMHGSYTNRSDKPRRATVINVFRDGVLYNMDGDKQGKRASPAGYGAASRARASTTHSSLRRRGSWAHARGRCRGTRESSSIWSSSTGGWRRSAPTGKARAASKPHRVKNAKGSIFTPSKIFDTTDCRILLLP